MGRHTHAWMSELELIYPFCFQSRTKINSTILDCAFILNHIIIFQIMGHSKNTFLYKDNKDNDSTESKTINLG